MTSFSYALVTISDRCFEGVREDLSGARIQELMQRECNVSPSRVALIPDEAKQISALLCELADEDQVDLVLTTGGTGMTPRDVTPEATRAVLDREASGIAEAIRNEGRKFTPYASLSRGVSGMRKHTLIINLSGSPKATEEQLQVVVPLLSHAIKATRGDCLHEK